ncbi:hypothetical protein E0489_11655 [Thermus tengchongensis]|uniref:Secreted protein n=1 Tax=Thermus tengchongensis TaxID=1214928 RepID=A0ABY2K5L3_9DEIN|nr:hypothetical protein E0489_11655 [Thermus tengchongensis]
MKAFWVAAAMAGGALLGVWWARKGKEVSPAPSNAPSSGGTVRWEDRSSGYSETTMCPQVIATCKDGSVAPTPCDCASRGGVASLGGAL